MAQLATAQFITSSGFATGLTPTVTITEALTGTVRGTFTMTEVSAGNYRYNYVDGNDQLLYFFNYDAGSASVINRYQGNNNKIEISHGGSGGTVIRNQAISPEQIDTIAKKVIELLPIVEQKDIVLDTSKIEETLNTIIDKLDTPDEEVVFDYEKILKNNDKNTKDIISKVTSIKIPKQDDTKVIQAIKDIPPMDTKPMCDMSSKIDDIMMVIDKEAKAMDTLKKVREQLSVIDDNIEGTTTVVAGGNDQAIMNEIDKLLND